MNKATHLPAIAAIGTLLCATSAFTQTYRTYPDGNREVVSDASTELRADTPAPARPKTVTSTLYIQYESTCQTAHYKCWGASGLSDQWQGITAPDVANAGVVRRGRTFHLKSSQTLSDPGNLRILSPAAPGHERVAVTSWDVVANSGRLEVTIPGDARVGDYRLEYGSDACTAYVIFDVYTKLEYLDQRQFDSWAYNDAAYGTQSFDYLNYLLYGPGPATDWSPDSSRLYAYRGGEAGRDDGVFGERLVELAASVHGWGAANEMEASRNLYEVVGQRLIWTSGGSFPGMSNGYVNTFDRVFNGEGVQVDGNVYTADELTVEVAEKAALGRGRVAALPDNYVISFGQCMNFASTTGALARAIGIPTRPGYTVATTGWYASFHVWSEMLIGETTVDFPGWTTPWWKFDGADQRREEISTHFEGSITPLRMDGWNDFVHNTLHQDDCAYQGGQFFGRYDLNKTHCADQANHTSVLLKPTALGPPTPPDSLIWSDFDVPQCPWTVVDTWSTYYGTGSGTVETDANGYALNLLMNRDNQGPPVIVNAETNDDLPFLSEGIETPGIVGGLGTNFYLVDVSNGLPLEVSIQKGAIHEGFGIRLYGSFDRTPYVRGITSFSDLSSSGGALSVSSIPADAHYLILMAVGEDDRQERFGNQVWHEYSLLLQRAATPKLLSLFPSNGSTVSGLVSLQASVDADTAELRIDGTMVPAQASESNGVVTLSYEWDATNAIPWSHHRIEIVGRKGPTSLYRFSDVVLREPSVIFFDGFETAGAEAWGFSASSVTTVGSWTIASPEEATTASPPPETTQPGSPADGVQCLFTGRNPDGEAGSDDIDDGAVIATMNDIDISDRSAIRLSYDLWWYNRDRGEDAQDFFRCEVKADDQTAWTQVQLIDSSAAPISWTTFEYDLSSLLDGHSTMSIRFSASDGPAGGNLIEAALDNVTVTGNPAPLEGSTLIIY